MRRQQSTFERMLQHILPIACTVFKPPQQLDQIGVQALHIRLVGDALTLLAHDLLDLLLSLRNHFLNARRMDASVLEQLIQGHTSNLAPHWVVTGKGHGLRRIVDNNIDAGNLLEGADIAALAADDPALELFAWERHSRNRDLGDIIGGAALNSQRDHLARGFIGLIARRALDLADAPRRIITRLSLDALENDRSRLLGTERRN